MTTRQKVTLGVILAVVLYPPVGLALIELLMLGFVLFIFFGLLAYIWHGILGG